jgi:hypothetical protein
MAIRSGCGADSEMPKGRVTPGRVFRLWADVPVDEWAHSPEVISEYTDQSAYAYRRTAARCAAARLVKRAFEPDKWLPCLRTAVDGETLCVWHGGKGTPKESPSEKLTRLLADAEDRALRQMAEHQKVLDIVAKSKLTPFQK